MAAGVSSVKAGGSLKAMDSVSLPCMSGALPSARAVMRASVLKAIERGESKSVE